MLSSTLFNILTYLCWLFKWSILSIISRYKNVSQTLHLVFFYVLSLFLSKGVCYSFISYAHDFFISQYFTKVEYMYLYNEVGIYFPVLAFKVCRCPCEHKHSLLSMIFFFPSFLFFRPISGGQYGLTIKRIQVYIDKPKWWWIKTFVTHIFPKEIFILSFHIDIPPWISSHSNLFIKKYYLK